MPLYFAYGSNLDAAGMRVRCPRSRVLGAARLMRHRVALMAQSGYASVVPAPAGIVHGLLYELAASDVASLDRYEDVAHGLYRKAVLPVLVEGGARRALVYLGNEMADGGTPPPGYMEGVVAAAGAAGLPAGYVAGLRTLLPRSTARASR